MEHRIGIGYDIHRLAKGRELIIGGVKIPYKKGLSGYSDADVLAHAISDAILGACGLADIGELFPNTDKRFKDIASTKLLQTIFSKIAKDFKVINVDSVIIIQEPKIAPYKKSMRRNIAKILGLNIDCVNIKAKTGENLSDPIGNGAAVSAHAAVLVSKKKKRAVV